MNKLLFASWAPFCSRSDNIARELGGESVLIYHSFWGSNYATILLKYLTQTVVTLRLLFLRRPDHVIVMTPPVIACFPVWLYCRSSGATYSIDAHSAAFVDPRWIALGFLQRFFSRGALTTIVTNGHWQSVVQGWCARSDIISDVPIQFPSPSRIDLVAGLKIAVVCTYTFDEPVDNIFRAAALIPDVTFYVTGNPSRVAPETMVLKPTNVRLTGFLPDVEYVSLLLQCSAVMSLTVLDHTMQRGAYEAAYLGRPVITSNFPVLRQAFPEGAVFVDNTPQSIAEGVRRVCESSEALESAAHRLREFKREQWLKAKAVLAALVFA